MASGISSPQPNFYCYKCQQHIGPVSNYECPTCKDGFIEEVIVPPQHQQSSRAGGGRDPMRGGFQFHRASPFNQTFVIGGDGGGANVDLGTFFQSFLNQFAGGSNQNLPFQIIPGHPGGAGFSLNPANLDTFLTQFLTQLENTGPAPAPENRINSIPTVKITAEQARDMLQCAICMDEFKEDEETKRLPCSHHFHQDCISRWLRLHGTCPTCRVTLDGENTSNREYTPSPSQFQQQPPPNSQQQPPRGGAGGGGASAGGFTDFDFD